MLIEVPQYLKDYYAIRETAFSTKHAQLQDEVTLGIASVMPKKAFYNEFASLTMSFGRRTGATYWMCKKVQALVKEGFRVSILCLNFKLATYIKRILLESNMSRADIDLITFATDHQDDESILKCLRDADYIFVDVSELMSRRTMDLVYEVFSGRLIVLL